MQVIAIDHGFGYMKATNGTKKIAYPNIVTHGHPKIFDYTTNPDPLANLHVKIYSDSKASGEYFVGELGKNESHDADFIKAKDRVNSEMARASLITAIALCAEDNTGQAVAIATGLPWAHYGQLRDAYVEGLIGEYKVEFIVDGKTSKTVEFSVPEEYIFIYPQGVGVYFDQIMDENGDYIEDHPLLHTATFGLIDVGTRTTDIELFENLQLNQNFCAGKDVGIESVKRAVASALASKNAPNQDGWVEEIVNGQSERARTTIKTRDLAPVIENSLMRLGKEVSNSVNALWEYKEDMLEIVFVAGGGGTKVYDYIELNAKNTKLQLVNRPMFANVYGFHKAALRAIRTEEAEREAVADGQ
jgi:hypothetical protein